MKRKRKMKTHNKTVLSVLPFTLFVVLLFFSPLNALAFNVDYLDYAKWNRNDNVTFEEIQKTSRGYTLSGVFGHYIDHQNMALYTYFAVDESTIKNENSIVQIQYTFYTDNEEYAFALDENGMCENASKEAEKLFSIGTNYEQENSGGYLSAVQYSGNEPYCYADVSFYVNGHRYIIKEGLYLERPTTTKEEKTTIPKTERTTKAKTTKSKATANSKTSAKKFTPQGKYTTASHKGTTKFRAESKSTKSKSEKPSTSSASVSNENTADVIKTSVTRMSPFAKGMLIASAVTAGIGIVLLLCSALTKNKPSEKAEKDANSKEE